MTDSIGREDAEAVGAEVQAAAARLIDNVGRVIVG